MCSTIGVCLNTLLNSIILLKFDGFVQSSAIELLGLEEWWRKRQPLKRDLVLKKTNDVKLDELPAKNVDANNDILPTTIKQ